MTQPVMQGGGEYDKHSAMQRAVGDYGLDALEWSAEKVPLPETGPVTIADYGSATGRNSVEPMAATIMALRRRMPREQPINVVHLDLSSNDFSSLFDTLAGTEGYGTGDRNAWTYAVGGSFYDQLLPNDTVTLGWCATAVHWLSHVPCQLTDTFWVPHATEHEQALIAAQAAADWRSFLTARANELVSGGRIAIMSLRRPIHPENSYTPTMRHLESVFRTMVADGTMRAAEWSSMCLPSYQRDTAEHLDPLREEPFVSLFEVEGYADLVRPSVLTQAFEETGDIEAFADATTGAARAAMEPVLKSCLDDDRSDEERDAVMDEYFTRLRASTLTQPVPSPGFETAALILRRR